MSKALRLAIAAAAVLVVAVVAYQFLPGRPGPGGQATPTPEPTAVVNLPGSGPIEAGTYRLAFGPPVLITLPPGWVSTGTGVRKHLEEPNEIALDGYTTSIRVFADACESADTDTMVGPTVDDLIAALLAQENSEVSDPVDVTVGGLPGKRFEITTPTGLDLDSCSIGALQIWVDATRSNYLAGIGDAAAIVYAADTPTGRLLFVLAGSDESATDVAERDAIVASLDVVE